MEIQPVSILLNPAGLRPPSLRVLIPNVDNYSVLLFQPDGHVEAGPTGVRHADRTLATQQFGSFLERARDGGVDLAVSPEYSMPWDTLLRVLERNEGPADGKLWVFGCESVPYSDLSGIRAGLEPRAMLLHETLTPEPGKFVDPLVYVFRTTHQDSGEPRTVAVVQFKTSPMGDPDHFEVNLLQRGNTIYQFGGGQDELRLVSLLCSDALAFEDRHALAIHDRALVLHLQLNEKPRQTQYRQYRDKLFRYKSGATELLCLNWASGVQVGCPPHIACWHKYSATAWYLAPDTFDHRDETLTLNHRRGLYYTYCPPIRSHALFFNHEACLYLLNATKVAHIGVVASLSHRRGPQLVEVRRWDSTALNWAVQPGLNDGFNDIVHECGNARGPVQDLATENPFDAERLLALTAGHVGSDPDWHNVTKLDSCTIEVSELIRRLTFCQELETADFRTTRLRRCGRLWDILQDPRNLPPAIHDLKDGFQLKWTPHQNIVANSGRRATAVYLGEPASDRQIEQVAKRLAEYLHRSSSDPDAAIEARQRVHIWYLDTAGQLQVLDPARYSRITDPHSFSEFDIARES